MPHILENEFIRVIIDSEIGAGILAFFVKKNDVWLPLMPDARNQAIDLDAASFVMIPYSNRIENGIFYFQGKKYILQDAHNHAIHGVTRKYPWRIIKKNNETVVFCFLSKDHNNVNWPWQFEAELTYTLRKNNFSSTITLWNRSDATMPSGFGWHPYFNRDLTHKDEIVLLCFKGTGVYPDIHETRIPSGAPIPIPEVYDFEHEKPLDSHSFFDKLYNGYNGSGSISWPESDIKLTFELSSLITHLIIYNPLLPYFSIEPVSNANNGFNLHAQGDPTSGIIELQSDQSANAEFTLHYTSYR